MLCVNVSIYRNKTHSLGLKLFRNTIIAINSIQNHKSAHQSKLNGKPETFVHVSLVGFDSIDSNLLRIMIANK